MSNGVFNALMVFAPERDLERTGNGGKIDCHHEKPLMVRTNRQENVAIS